MKTVEKGTNIVVGYTIKERKRGKERADQGRFRKRVEREGDKGGQQ